MAQEEEVLRLAKAVLESVRPIREGQPDDGHDPDVPLMTGTVSAEDVLYCLFDHPAIDHDLRCSIKWTPVEHHIEATMIGWDASGDTVGVRRTAYAQVAAKEE